MRTFASRSSGKARSTRRSFTFAASAARASPAEIDAAISPRLAKAALAAKVDDRLVDLSHPLEADASVRIVTPESPEALPLYRHST
ncbi:MAG: TGS domain-containing protein, partial [Vicinamibacterales bacterium]